MSGWCGSPTRRSRPRRRIHEKLRIRSASTRSRSLPAASRALAPSPAGQRCRRAERQKCCAPRQARTRPARCARSTSRACRSAKAPFTFKPGDRATEAPFPIYRSRSATTSRASRLPASVPPARCNSSTAGGGAAPSALCPAQRSRRLAAACYRQAITSSEALGPFAECAATQGESPRSPSSHFLDPDLPMLILADVGNVAGDAPRSPRALDRDGGVLCVSAGPRLAARTTILCR